jgi:hypothetical protein
MSSNMIRIYFDRCRLIRFLEYCRKLCLQVYTLFDTGNWCFFHFFDQFERNLISFGVLIYLEADISFQIS